MLGHSGFCRGLVHGILQGSGRVCRLNAASRQRAKGIRINAAHRQRYHAFLLQLQGKLHPLGRIRIVLCGNPQGHNHWIAFKQTVDVCSTQAAQVGIYLSDVGLRRLLSLGSQYRPVNGRLGNRYSKQQAAQQRKKPLDHFFS